LNQRLEHLFDQLEHARRNLLKDLIAYPEHTLTREPGSGQWSVNQILIHLLTSEQLTLIYLKKKSLGIQQLSNSGIDSELRLLVLKVSQRLPLRFKAPKFLVQHTPTPVSLKELTDRWDFTRGELQTFLESFNEMNLRKLVYKHPVAGRFNVSQCLVFMHEHFHHHLPQIKRILRDSVN